MKQIPNYDGYFATIDGRIWSEKHKKYLKPSITEKGYHNIFIYRDKVRKSFRVHKLVWITWMGEIPKGYEINHINEDKSDNRLENLELLTHYENIMYGSRGKKSGITMSNLWKNYPEKWNKRLENQRKKITLHDI